MKVKIYSELARYMITHNGDAAFQMYLTAKILSKGGRSIDKGEFFKYCRANDFSKAKFYSGLKKAFELGFLYETTDGKKQYINIVSLDKVSANLCEEYTEAYFLYEDEILDKQIFHAMLYAIAFSGLIQKGKKEATISRDNIREILGITKKTQQRYEGILDDIVKKHSNALDMNIIVKKHDNIVDFVDESQYCFKLYDKENNNYRLYRILPNSYSFDVSERRANPKYKYTRKAKKCQDKSLEKVGGQVEANASICNKIPLKFKVKVSHHRHFFKSQHAASQSERRSALNASKGNLAASENTLRYFKSDVMLTQINKLSDSGTLKEKHRCGSRTFVVWKQM